MKITFSNIRDERTQPGQIDVSSEQAELVRGDLEISIDGLGNSFRRPDVSVPLIIAETKLFLARLQQQGRATWRIFFAPFLDGQLEDGTVRLMVGSRDHLSGKVVETVSRENLLEIEAKLNELERSYGRLTP